jgi:MFS family permease
VAGRAVQGIGAAFMMPGTLSIISNAFPPAERGKAIGTWAGVSAIALALGPLVGGWLTEDVSWRAIFFLNLPVAAGAIAVTLFAAHESRDDTVSRQVDIPGIATLTVGLTALVLTLVQGNSWGWGSPEIIALLATAVISLGAFVAIERSSPRRSSTSTSSARARSWAPTSSRSPCRSRCWRCSSSSRSTCRTSSATAHWRRACASCPRR